MRSWPIETAAFSFANAQPDASGRTPAGAVGSVAGQLAKADGARVVGIAGGPRSARFSPTSGALTRRWTTAPPTGRLSWSGE